MTKAQIRTILNDLNYSLDNIISLKEISSISTDTDAHFYPGKTNRFNFTSDGLMLVYNGIEDGENFKFENKNIPSIIVPFFSIMDISLVNPLNIPEPYRLGRSV